MESNKSDSIVLVRRTTRDTLAKIRDHHDLKDYDAAIRLLVKSSKAGSCIHQNENRGD